MTKTKNRSRLEASHTVCFFTANNPRPKASQTVDLSLEGTRIETPHGLISGERLKISIAIHSQVIKCRGEVVDTQWLDGERLKVRVRSEDLSKQDRLYLDGYISSFVKQRK